jgi:hypothetical protein
MPTISLPPFHVTTRKKIQVDINHELDHDLEQYRAYYRQAYGAEVSDADLLREMARRFMADDRPFQEFRRGGRPPRARPSRRPEVAITEAAALP